MIDTAVPTCPALEDPHNGKVVIIKNVANYTCSKGYTLIGSPVRTCKSGGVWNGSAPICQGVYTVLLLYTLPLDGLYIFILTEQCPSLPKPAHGQVVYLPSNRSVGSIAIYMCDSRYNLSESGSSIRMCQSGGTWSGSAPTCQGIHMHSSSDWMFYTNSLCYSNSNRACL